MAEQISGRPARIEYRDEVRVGDHQWYISSTARFRSHYPEWTVTFDVPAILREIHASNAGRWIPRSPGPR